MKEQENLNALLQRIKRDNAIKEVKVHGFFSGKSSIPDKIKVIIQWDESRIHSNAVRSAWGKLEFTANSIPGVIEQITKSTKF